MSIGGALSSAWGRAWGLVFGAAPAREFNRTKNRSFFAAKSENRAADQGNKVEFQPDKKPAIEIGRNPPEATETATPVINFGCAARIATGFVRLFRLRDHNNPINALKNIAIGLGRMFLFCLRNPILVVVMLGFLFGFGWLRGCMTVDMPWLKDTPDELRAALKEERVRAAMLTQQAELERLARELAEANASERNRVAGVIEQAHTEIEDAANAQDFDRLSAAYQRAYISVWNDAEPAGDPNPDPGGFAPVRRPSASPA